LSQDLAAWRNLRRLLKGEDLAERDCDERLAHVALKGGVLRLALNRVPALEEWMAKEAEKRVFQDLLLERSQAAVATVLAQGGCEGVVLLKGSASAHTLYSQSTERERRDLDLLVVGDAFGAAARSLREGGWRDLAAEKLPWWAKRPEGRYEITLVGPEGVEVDLHRRLSLYRHFPIDLQGIAQRAQILEDGPFHLPDPVDLALHTALHAASTGFRVPLKSWLDLKLLAQAPTFDWESFAGRALSWRIDTAAWAALGVIESFFAVSIPKAVIEQLGPPRPVKASLKKLLSHEGETPIAPGRFADAWRQVAKSLALGGRRPWELAMEHARLRTAGKDGKE
jgi:hypothetical protein